MWMPLPSLQLDQQEFALITIEQKRKIDEMFMGGCNLMDPIIFHNMMLEITMENIFASFVV
jgi:hypothetical protein